MFRRESEVRSQKSEEVGYCSPEWLGRTGVSVINSLFYYCYSLYTGYRSLITDHRLLTCPPKPWRRWITVSFLLITVYGFSQKVKRIELRHANSLEFDKSLGVDAKRLLGNVAFEHEGALMFCDSAYLYSNNALDAFGNIHIQKGDSLHLYGDLLKYDGNEKKADVQKNVRLIEKDMTLTTDILYYDVKNSIANYLSGAKIVDKENTLTSVYGFYYSSTKELLFKKNVVLVNPEYTMNCDTLRYNTVSKTAYFPGPTTIKGKENLIYCENGWYDTENDVSQFSKNAYLVSKEQKLKSDSLHYDRKQGIGKAFRNIEIIDTAQNITIKGEYGEYFEATGNSIVTKKALLIQAYDKDTLFMHADTLRSEYEVVKKSEVGSQKSEEKKKKEDSKPSKKNGKQPTTNLSTEALAKVDNPEVIKDDNRRVMYAYHKVKFYKKDMQGRCDSLVFTNSDSTMRLFTDPIIWSDKNQLTGERIEIKTHKGKLDRLFLTNNSFIVSEEDTSKYNQIKGKTMKGFFMDNDLKKVFVEGSGQAVYYPKDGPKLIGVNKVDCTNMLIIIEENDIKKITFITKPDATLYPIDELKPTELLLKGFNWRIKEKPLSAKDVFVW